MNILRDPVVRYFILPLVGALVLIGLFGFVLGYTSEAKAQHDHAAGHNDYSSWASGKIGNCCNNQDCGELKEDEWREGASGAEVKIAGVWCPVERKHYIVKGKSPDWNKAHACVGTSSYWASQPPCERLLCFSGPGGV